MSRAHAIQDQFWDRIGDYDSGELVRISDSPILYLHLSVGGTPGDVSEELVTQEKRKKGGEWTVTQVKHWKGWRMNCGVGKATEGQKNEL